MTELDSLRADVRRLEREVYELKDAVKSMKAWVEVYKRLTERGIEILKRNAGCSDEP